jgi:transcriptional regulator of heat shock response
MSDDKLATAKYIRGKIDDTYPCVRNRSSGWYPTLKDILTQMGQILDHLNQYIVVTPRHSIENLQSIRSEIIFAYQILSDDVIELRETLIRKNPKWKSFVEEAKNLVRKPTFDALDALDTYIELLEQADDAAKDDPSHHLPTIRSNIKSVKEQRREFLESFSVFRDKFNSLVKQLKRF